MAQTYIGAPVRRREDVRFLTGKATFVDDIKLPYMLHAAILRSTQAHARIMAIDASRALAIPGVVAVFTFQDIAPVCQTHSHPALPPGRSGAFFTVSTCP